MAEPRALAMIDRLRTVVDDYGVSERQDKALCSLLLLGMAFVYGSPSDEQERARALLEVLRD